MSSLTRPSQVCRALLAALDASDGRRRVRKRDQRPDAIGLAIKRELLERVVAADPEPADLEPWLLQYVQANEGHASPGAVSAMARVVFDEWRLAQVMPDFSAWLARGAPSDDARPAAITVAQSGAD
jgi:hypothetical protein